MTVADLETQQEIFQQLISQVETDYHLYFGLKSIQKRLDYTERIFDHFKLDEQLGLSFNEGSDLPDEIRHEIQRVYQQVFL